MCVYEHTMYMLCVQLQAHCYPMCQCVLQHKNKANWEWGNSSQGRELLSLLFLFYSPIQRLVAPVQLPHSTRKLFQLCKRRCITWRHIDLYFHSCACCTHAVHVSQKCLVVFWHARGRGDLTCAVTPAAPHVLQLGKLHSARLSGEARSRVARNASAQTTHWIRWPRGDRTNVLFKEAEPPSCRCVLSSPLESSFFMTHGHTIAAHWACPLMFARARVHNVHTWQGEAELRGRVTTKSKGRWKGWLFLFLALTWQYLWFACVCIWFNTQLREWTCQLRLASGSHVPFKKSRKVSEA